MELITETSLAHGENWTNKARFVNNSNVFGSGANGLCGKLFAWKILPGMHTYIYETKIKSTKYNHNFETNLFNLSNWKSVCLMSNLKIFLQSQLWFSLSLCQYKYEGRAPTQYFVSDKANVIVN